MTDNVTHLPEPGVILDLDIEEKDPKDQKPPFTVKVGGRAITFKDPNDIEWQRLASIQIPADLIHVSLEREERQHIFAQNLPTWKFNKLMESYYDHYDLEAKIEAARRQAQFNRI